jgi:hypothetical protein
MIPHLEAESWPTDWNTVGQMSSHVCVPLRLTLISGICPPFHPFLSFVKLDLSLLSVVQNSALLSRPFRSSFLVFPWFNKDKVLPDPLCLII